MKTTFTTSESLNNRLNYKGFRSELAVWERLIAGAI